MGLRHTVPTATASLPAGETFDLYVAGSKPQQLVIEDDQTPAGTAARARAATALRPISVYRLP
jgi:hypothetical protein